MTVEQMSCWITNGQISRVACTINHSVSVFLFLLNYVGCRIGSRKRVFWRAESQVVVRVWSDWVL